MSLGYLGCACRGREIPLSGFAGFGAFGINVQSASTTAQYAAAGAKVGSIVPGIGTAIGAVVGLAAAALKHIFGNHDVRVDGATKGQCQNTISQYITAGGGTIGAAMTKDQLEQLNWCMMAVYGGPTYNVDPRYFTLHYQWAEKAATQLVKGILTQAPGTMITFTPISATSAQGKDTYTFTPKPVKVPTSITVGELSTIFNDIRAQGCACCGNKYPANCPALFQQPGMKQWASDFILYVMNRDFPKTLAPPAQQPATAAKPATPVPTQKAPTSPVAASTPAVSTAISPVPQTGATSAGVDINAMIRQMLANGASQQQAYTAAMQNLQAAGVQPTPQVQQAVADAVQNPSQASIVGDLPKWAIVVAGGAALFMIMKPPKGGRRARK